MPIAEGHVTTSRADRYLGQLCEHLGQLSHGAARHGHGHSAGSSHEPPPVLHASADGHRGLIVFGWGTCALLATDDELQLRLESADAGALERAREQIGQRIATIGRRDGLRVTWQGSGS